MCVTLIFIYCNFLTPISKGKSSIQRNHLLACNLLSSLQRSQSRNRFILSYFIPIEVFVIVFLLLKSPATDFISFINLPMMINDIQESENLYSILFLLLGKRTWFDLQQYWDEIFLRITHQSLSEEPVVHCIHLHSLCSLLQDAVDMGRSHCHPYEVLVDYQDNLPQVEHLNHSPGQQHCNVHLK